jgi:hypothetical protein
MTVTQLNEIQARLELTDEEVERIRKWWMKAPSEPEAQESEDSAGATL